MEAYKKVMIVVLGIMMIVGSGPMLGNAQYSFCHVTNDGLNACLPYASKDSSVDPDTACCATIRKADLNCLCRYKSLVPLYVPGVDVDKAMELPVKCKVVQSFKC